MWLKTQISKRGSINLHGAGYASVQLLATQDKYNPEARLNARIFTDQDCYWMLFWQKYPLPEICISCESADGEQITIKEPRHFKAKGRDAEVDCDSYVHTPFSSQIATGNRIRVEVYLTSPGILRDRRNVKYNPDGTVERLGGVLPEVEWSYERRIWSGSVEYMCEPSKVDHLYTSTLIPVPILSCEFETDREFTRQLHKFSHQMAWIARSFGLGSRIGVCSWNSPRVKSRNKAIQRVSG